MEVRTAQAGRQVRPATETVAGGAWGRRQGGSSCPCGAAVGAAAPVGARVAAVEVWQPLQLKQAALTNGCNAALCTLRAH